MKKKLVLLLIVAVCLAACSADYYEWERAQAVPAEKCAGYAFSLYADTVAEEGGEPDVLCADLYEHNYTGVRYWIVTWTIIDGAEEPIERTIYTSHAWVVDNATGHVSEIGYSSWQEE